MLLASGLIVGESLWGVALAGLIVATGKGEPLGLPFIGAGFTPVAAVIGLAAFAAITAALYRRVSVAARRVG